MSTSVRCRWCTATSQLTGRPSALACRISAMPAADESRHRCTRQFVARTSSKMVCNATVSATTGTPGRPRRAATGPLCATPPRPRYGSFACNHTVNPKVRAYCIARSSTCVSRMSWAACEKPTQPASASSAISVMTSPFRPTVRAPSGYRCAPSSPRARCLSISTRPGSSRAGSVSGGHDRLVTPPASAACISDSSVALYS